MTPDLDPARDEAMLSTLLDINQTLSGSPNLRSGLRRMLEALSRHDGILRSAVTLLNADTGELHVEAAHGGSVDHARATRFRIGEGVTGRVVESCKPVIVPQVSREPLFLNRAARPDLDKKEISYVCVP